MHQITNRLLGTSGVFALLVLFLLYGGCSKDPNQAEILQATKLGQKIRVLLHRGRTNFTIYSDSQIAANSTDNQRIYPRKSKLSITVKDGSLVLNGEETNLNQITFSTVTSLLALDLAEYRGTIKALIRSDGTIDVINTLPVEQYLGGVISSEIPASWEPEVLKAQTIAARTYSIYIKNRFGIKRSWDVKRTQANQVYRGVSAEFPQTWEAIMSTRGQVLMCKNDNNDYEIFPTYYCSVCGGHTEDSKMVFGDSYASLRGVNCNYCKKVARKSHLEWGPLNFPVKLVNERLLDKYPSLKKLGTIKDISPVRKSEYFRLTRITRFKLTGIDGKTDIVGGEDLRLTIDPTGKKFKSVACKVKYTPNGLEVSHGTGYGHGVGMCQYGAFAMSRDNKTSGEILEHYYPKSKLFNILENNESR